jgi:NADH-quinone oxidoreductase subunit J
LNLADINTELWLMILLLGALVVFAVISVMIRNLLKAAVALAVTSAALTTLLFIMNAYLAAVFELSVCAGLITVVFISAISLTKPHSREELMVKAKQRIKRFIYLPILLIAVSAVLLFIKSNIKIDFLVQSTGSESTVEEVLWNVRGNDMLGQIIVMLAGVFGVIILFKGREKK